MIQIKPSKEQIGFYFEKVVELIESGISASDAIANLGLNSKSFYKRLDTEQSAKLYRLKLTNCHDTDQSDLMAGIKFMNGDF